MRSPSCFGWRDGTHCAEASRLTEHKLLDVRAKLADLAHMEFVLSQCRLVCACDARTVCLSVRFFPFRELTSSGLDSKGEADPLLVSLYAKLISLPLFHGFRVRLD